MTGVAVVANLALVGAYASIAMLSGPMLAAFGVKSRLVHAGFVGFFLLCAATHMEQIMHAITDTPLTVADQGSPTHLAIHVPQAAAAVWVVIGVRRAVESNLHGS